MAQVNSWSPATSAQGLLMVSWSKRVRQPEAKRINELNEFLGEMWMDGWMDALIQLNSTWPVEPDSPGNLCHCNLIRDWWEVPWDTRFASSSLPRDSHCLPLSLSLASHLLTWLVFAKQQIETQAIWVTTFIHWKRKEKNEWKHLLSRALSPFAPRILSRSKTLVKERSTSHCQGREKGRTANTLDVSFNRFLSLSNKVPVPAAGATSPNCGCVNWAPKGTCHSLNCHTCAGSFVSIMHCKYHLWRCFPLLQSLAQPHPSVELYIRFSLSLFFSCDTRVIQASSYLDDFFIRSFAQQFTRFFVLCSSFSPSLAFLLAPGQVSFALWSNYLAKDSKEQWTVASGYKYTHTHTHRFDVQWKRPSHQPQGHTKCNERKRKREKERQKVLRVNSPNGLLVHSLRTNTHILFEL